MDEPPTPEGVPQVKSEGRKLLDEQLEAINELKIAVTILKGLDFGCTAPISPETKARLFATLVTIGRNRLNSALARGERWLNGLPISVPRIFGGRERCCSACGATSIALEQLGFYFAAVLPLASYPDDAAALAAAVAKKWQLDGVPKEFGEDVQQLAIQLRGHVDVEIQTAIARCTAEFRQWEAKIYQAGADATPAEPRNENAEAKFVFAPDGDGYYIRGFGEQGHVRKLKGLDIIYQLIQTPGRLTSMYQLDGSDKVDRLGYDAYSRQPTVDREAQGAIWDSLRQSKRDLERAKAENNTVEATHCQEEIDKLTRTLKTSIGIAGVPRDLNNPINKLRPKLSGALNRAYDALKAAAMPQLAEHFDRNISSESGAFVYKPAGLASGWTTNKSPVTLGVTG